MELKYNLTVDDLLVFARYVYDTSSTHRRARRTTILIWIVALLAVTYLIYRIVSFPVTFPLILIWLPIAALIIYLMLLWNRRYFLKNYIRMQKESPNNILTGEHLIRITDSGLFGRSVSGDGNTFWSAIEHIDTVGDHTLVFIHAVAAIVIPKSGVVEGDYDVFVGALKERYEGAKSL